MYRTLRRSTILSSAVVLGIRIFLGHRIRNTNFKDIAKKKTDDMVAKTGNGIPQET